MAERSTDELVKEVVSVSIGGRTDRPSVFEGVGGRGGQLTIREHFLSDFGESTGEVEITEGTLFDVVLFAAGEGGNFGSIDIEGLTAAESASVLSDPKFIDAASEIASMDGDLKINGVDYQLVDGKFVEFGY